MARIIPNPRGSDTAMMRPNRKVKTRVDITGTKTRRNGFLHPSWNINPSTRSGILPRKPITLTSKRVITSIADEKTRLVISFLLILTFAFPSVARIFLMLKKADAIVKIIPNPRINWGHQAEPSLPPMFKTGNEKEVIYKNSITTKTIP
jgi:hypothetical protein